MASANAPRGRQQPLVSLDAARREPAIHPTHGVAPLVDDDHLAILGKGQHDDALALGEIVERGPLAVG